MAEDGGRWRRQARPGRRRTETSSNAHRTVPVEPGGPAWGPPTTPLPSQGPSAGRAQGARLEGTAQAAAAQGRALPTSPPLHRAASPLLLSRNFSLPGWFTASAGIQHICHLRARGDTASRAWGRAIPLDPSAQWAAAVPTGKPGAPASSPGTVFELEAARTPAAATENKGARGTRREATASMRVARRGERWAGRLHTSWRVGQGKESQGHGHIQMGREEN